MKKLFFIAALSLCFSFVKAQKTLCVAFYNQENLFDTIDDPHKNDNEFLPSSQKQWNTEKYRSKVHNMAQVISSMNEGKAPDVLGMCEVENDVVLNDLVTDEQLKSAKYKFVRFDSPDERSIDNALLYKPSQFKLIDSRAIPIRFPDNDDKTRDILFVKLEAKNKEQIIFLVNHFPSRSGGEEASAPKRIFVASVLRNICDTLLQANPDQDIVIMGDFNDEPTNLSLDSVLRGKETMYNLNNGNLYNPMFEIKQAGLGSYYYKGKWDMLDQIIMSNGIALGNRKLAYKKESADIFKQPWMLETDPKYKGAPLRTFAGNKYLKGYSDHLPVFIYIEFKK